MKLVGHLVLNYSDGLTGQEGSGYNYILAREGVFVTSQSDLLEATVRIAKAEVRGLGGLDDRTRLRLLKGKVPRHIWDLAYNHMLACLPNETYMAITWFDGMYHLEVPSQSTSPGSVEYETLRKVVVELHSHATMRAYFSGTDNADEKGFRVYGVVGRLDQVEPEASWRVGVYGYYGGVGWEDIFA